MDNGAAAYCLYDSEVRTIKFSLVCKNSSDWTYSPKTNEHINYDHLKDHRRCLLKISLSTEEFNFHRFACPVKICKSFVYLLKPFMPWENSFFVWLFSQWSHPLQNAPSVILNIYASSMWALHTALPTNKTTKSKNIMLCDLCSNTHLLRDNGYEYMADQKEVWSVDIYCFHWYGMYQNCCSAASCLCMRKKRYCRCWGRQTDSTPLLEKTSVTKWH